MGASVWRVGRTAEDRLMYRSSINAATSGNLTIIEPAIYVSMYVSHVLDSQLLNG